MIELGCDVWLLKPLPRWLRWAASIGCRHVEIICDRDLDGAGAATPIPVALADQARTLAGELGLGLGVCASVWNLALGDDDPAWAARSADAVRCAIEFAARAGAAWVVVRTDPDAGLRGARRRERFLDHAERLSREAAAAGVTLALENLHDPLPLFRDLLGRPELAAWAVLWNVAHAHAFGGPLTPAAGLALLPRAPLAFALSDNDGHSDGHLGIGRGSVDVRGFLPHALGAQVPLFIEVHEAAALEASVRTVRRWARRLAT
ncbi:MAG: sugar phosphate isomerase/epimerase [Deltaproteobacteria bacterium]|nr:sugar phosphate isomerase/epimerase [Deltaproteobacteria bacterium]